MADGFKIAKAWIEVEPDTTGFKDKLDAAIDRDKVTAKVGISVDPAGLAKLKAATDAASADAGSSGGHNFASKFVSGTTFGKTGAIVTGIGAALATLPGLAGIAGIGMGVELTTELTAVLARQNPALQKAALSVFGGTNAQGKQVTGALTTTLEESFKPMVPAIEGVFKQILGLAHAVVPELTALFKMIAPQIGPIFKNISVVVQQLIGVMQAAAPAFGPFINAILGLVKNILPGLAAIIHATVPVVGVFGATMGKLGAQIGGMLTAMTPAVTASMQVIKVLLGAIGGLLPIIGKLAATITKDLAPILVSLLGAFKALEPSITLVAGVLAKFAGAVLSSVAGTLTLLANIIKGISPGIAAFGKAFAGVFTVLENSGVLFELENAIASLVGPITNLINVLLVGLAPVLPILINAAGQLAAALAKGLGVALATLLTLITPLVGPLLRLVDVVVEFMSHLGPLLPMLLGAVIAFKNLTVAVGIFNAVMNLNPFIAITTGLIILVALVIKYHTQILNFIEDTWNKIMSFLRAWWPLLLGVFTGGFGLIIAAIIKYHAQIFSFIQTAWNNIYAFFQSIFAKIISFFATSWNTIYATIRSVWNTISGWFQTWWNANYQLVSTAISKLTGFLSSAWNTIRSGVSSAWNAITAVFQNFWSGLKSGFNTAVSAVTSIWGKLEQAVKTPVQFIVNTVYDDGIVKVVNAVGGLIGLHLNPISFAEGGKVTQGTGPKDDDVLARVSKGETVVSAEHSSMLSGIFSAVGVPGYASGGIPNPLGAIGHVLGDVWSGLKSLTGDALAEAASHILNPLLNEIPTGGTVIGSDIKKIPVSIVAKLIALLKGTAAAGGGTGGPAGKMSATEKQIASWWTGAGGPGGMTSHIAAAITGAESGFNVRAIQQGQPYATTGWGLWQITPGNSEPQAGINNALLTGPTNAIAAVAKYRGAGGSFSPWTTYEDGAYKAFMDLGGYLRPGTTVVQNNTGQLERVVNPASEMAAAANGGGMRSGAGVTVNFYGTQYPSPEQIAALKLELAAAIGVA